MAPHLRLEDWTRLYQPDGMMRLYWRPIPNDLHQATGKGWRYCNTQDAATALRNRVLSDGAWELAWATDEAEFQVIASSEDCDYWRGLLDRAGAFAQ